MWKSNPYSLHFSLHAIVPENYLSELFSFPPPAITLALFSLSIVWNIFYTPAHRRCFWNLKFIFPHTASRVFLIIRFPSLKTLKPLNIPCITKVFLHFINSHMPSKALLRPSFPEESLPEISRLGYLHYACLYFGNYISYIYFLFVFKFFRNWPLLCRIYCNFIIKINMFK